MQSSSQGVIGNMRIRCSLPISRNSHPGFSRSVIRARTRATTCFDCAPHSKGSRGYPPGVVYSEAQLQSAFASPRFPALYRGTQRAVARFLADRGRLSAIESNDRFAALRPAAFTTAPGRLRGLAPATVHQHESTVADFLSRAISHETALGALTSTDIARYVELKSREVTRQTLQHVAAHLRAFLRYSRDRGDTVAALECIDTPRTYREELPPRALDWKLVQACSPRWIAASNRLARLRHPSSHGVLWAAALGDRRAEVDRDRLVREDARVEQRKTRSSCPAARPIEP